MGKGANPASCPGERTLCVCAVRAWLAEAEMQLNCEVLWEEQRRGGTEREQRGSGRGGSEALGEVALKLWQS